MVKWFGYWPAVLLVISAAHHLWGQSPDWPQFTIQGATREAGLLNRLHRNHHSAAFSNCTLWDRWLPHATLWTSDTKRAQVRQSLLSRHIDAAGYVSMQQHRGMAHADGWPFPAWQQSTGKGFHFSIDHETWAIQHFNLEPAQTWDDWQVDGAQISGIDPSHGLQLSVDDNNFQITTPQFRCGTIVAPFVRIEWEVSGSRDETEYWLEWLLEGETAWPEHRRHHFSLDSVDGGMHYLHLPLYRQPDYGGMVTQYRLQVRHGKGLQINLKSLITAVDTRHPITNSNYLRAGCDYFCWTGEVEFLQKNIGRMRQALQFMLSEFSVREQRHVLVPWVGHDGRSGITFDSLGNKVIRPGLGIGNNYWDLLPFGGHDGLATIYLYDALQRFSEIEEAIAQHPSWEIEPPSPANSASSLSQLAAEVRSDFQQRFWNVETGRFIGWQDRGGQSYDYGFTFVNLEAIAYGLATKKQAESLLAWLNGERTIDEDTSIGVDIYHWRFAPRATTRRNVETYVWAWSAPEAIDWGQQVQDGGAVLGFSYHDLLARLKTRGPEDAWERLQAILDWYQDIEQAGGYRAYYAVPGRGTLQGGGTAGGLGLDQEFLESVLLPQILLYGFLGFQPTPTNYRLNPQLPQAWQSLTISNIHYQQRRLTITAHADGRVEVVEAD